MYHRDQPNTGIIEETEEMLTFNPCHIDFLYPSHEILVFLLIFIHVYITWVDYQCVMNFTNFKEMYKTSSLITPPPPLSTPGGFLYLK